MLNLNFNKRSHCSATGVVISADHSGADSAL